MNFSSFGPWLALLVSVLLSACAGQPSNPIEPVPHAESLTAPLIEAIPGTEAITAELLARQTRFKQALELQKSGDYEPAIDLLTELHQLDPAASGPLANLGLIALKQDRPQDAERYFQQVLERQPNHPVVLNALGVVAREAGRFDQAESYYRQVLAVAPDDLAALRNLGILLELYRGRLDEALALYQRCQKLQREPDAQMKDWIFDLTGRVEKER